MMQPHVEERGQTIQVGSASAGPRGIGTGVALDWGLSVQFLAQGLVAALTPGAGISPIARIGMALLSVVGALVPFALGELLRRGVWAAWLIQVIASGGLTLAGLFFIPSAIASFQRERHFGLLVRLVIMLGVAPVLFYLLLQPQTRRWFRETTTAEARARHGGRWLIGIAALAIIGGVAIAFEGLY